MAVKFRHITYRLLGFLIIFISLLYSENPSQVNQLHSFPSNLGLIEPLVNDSSLPIKAYVHSETLNFKAAEPFWIKVSLTIAPSWNIYWKNPGDAGMPVSVTWELPPGFKAGELQWPYPQRFESPSSIGFGYENEVHFLCQIFPPENLNHSDTYKFRATIKYLACSDSACLPGETNVQMNLTSTSFAPVMDKSLTSIFEQARRLLPKTRGNITAKRINDLIELNMPSPLAPAEKILNIFFFPEEGQSVDYHLEPSISLQESSFSSYSIAFKEKDSSLPTTVLKGVLVLTIQQAEKIATEAIEVAVPIQDLNKENSVWAFNEAFPRSWNITLSSKSSDYEGGLGMALILAFLGGMLLNLMPCVLPVISFKILSFVKMSGQSRQLTLQHGLMFSAGVLVSFWILSAALLILKAYGHAVGWGFQLQEPAFVALLSAVLFIFSLSLFGVFEIGIKVGSFAGQLQHQGTKKGRCASFLSGVLATLIATPCTGPFLGTAVGFAMTLPFYLSFLIFTSLGMGMASPYLILSAYPSFLRFLPKPGKWMETFKQFMGFIMLASVLWLMWVFAAQTNALALILLLGAFFMISMACWIYGRWATPLHSKLSCRIATSVAIFGLLASLYALLYASKSTSPSISFSPAIAEQEVIWEEFSPQRLAELTSQGIPVFVDFTAKWCLICQANHMILGGADVHAQFNEQGVVRMKADWTKKDAAITEELQKFGRHSVPLYVLYQQEQEPFIFPQLLTPSLVINKLKAIK
ncbi:protein-disulfide reductase DsbD [Neochlamydia sp. S13]|uniref:protein-disulfide reductase DsbD family protein n=1 Tax=Neochlamydia sp. S13 TaxID=1353976 RepID=UPI0009AE76F7|nr:protein-disulfide reductase DsbD domain-containing protein [Neochlamydia sp. S13]